MCGAQLQHASMFQPDADVDTQEREPPQTGGGERSSQDPPLDRMYDDRMHDDQMQEGWIEDAPASEGSAPDREWDRRESPTNEFTLFRSVAGASSSLRGLDWESEPSSSPPYRLYIGAVLAVVIVALGYLAWRSSQSTQSSRAT